MSMLEDNRASKYREGGWRRGLLFAQRSVGRPLMGLLSKDLKSVRGEPCGSGQECWAEECEMCLRSSKDVRVAGAR